MKTQNITHALIYTRVACGTLEHIAKGHCAQENKCRIFVETKNMVVEKIFTDHCSGNDANRNGFSELIAYIKSNPETSFVVVVDRPDRLARDFSVYETLKSAIIKKGASIALPELDALGQDKVDPFLKVTNAIAELEERLELENESHAPRS